MTDNRTLRCCLMQCLVRKAKESHRRAGLQIREHRCERLAKKQQSIFLRQASMLTDLIDWLSGRNGTIKNRGLRGIALINDTQVKTTAKILIFHVAWVRLLVIA